MAKLARARDATTTFLYDGDGKRVLSTKYTFTGQYSFMHDPSTLGSEGCTS